MTYDFIIGFLAGIFATSLFEFIRFWINKRALKKKFGKLDGVYKGYEFKQLDKDDKEQKEKFSWELENKSVSRAEIKYERDNILSISLTHHKELTWEGLITMELENYGTISWQYINLPENQLRFGFKRYILNPEGDKIYLIGEEGEGYYKEVLIRDKLK